MKNNNRNNYEERLLIEELDSYLLGLEPSALDLVDFPSKNKERGNRRDSTKNKKSARRSSFNSTISGYRYIPYRQRQQIEEGHPKWNVNQAHTWHAGELDSKHQINTKYSKSARREAEEIISQALEEYNENKKQMQEQIRLCNHKKEIEFLQADIATIQNEIYSIDPEAVDIIEYLTYYKKRLNNMIKDIDGDLARFTK